MCHETQIIYIPSFDATQQQAIGPQRCDTNKQMCRRLTGMKAAHINHADPVGCCATHGRGTCRAESLAQAQGIYSLPLWERMHLEQDMPMLAHCGLHSWCRARTNISYDTKP
jgi:hypothetical protein